jgi:hypothetical protein
MTKKMPIDAVVIGIIDSITVNDGEVYHDKAGA